MLNYYTEKGKHLQKTVLSIHWNKTKQQFNDAIFTFIQMFICLSGQQIKGYTSSIPLADKVQMKAETLHHFNQFHKHADEIVVALMMLVDFDVPC